MTKPDPIFNGVFAAFWGLTASLMGFLLFVSFAGVQSLIPVLLISCAIYAVLGIGFGIWAARRAVARSLDRRR